MLFNSKTQAKEFNQKKAKRRRKAVLLLATVVVTLSMALTLQSYVAPDLQMKVKVSSILPAPKERVVELLKLPKTLFFVAQPVTTFTDHENFPVWWEVGETVQTQVKMFGMGAGKDYQITFTTIDEDLGLLVTHESGEGIDSWIHTMSVEEMSNGRSRYTDIVEVKAGLMTIPTAVFIKFYYQHRHRRWLKILQ